MKQPMPERNDASTTGLVPLLRYRDVGAAVDWLCNAFGFERHDAVRSQEGSIIFAQIKHGSSMIMLVPVGRSDLDELMTQPDEIGGAETQACYVVVADTHAHYQRAQAAGAEVVLEMTGDGAGRHGYTCRDFEGHIWSFGTYDPWYGSSPAQVTGRRGKKHVRRSDATQPRRRPSLGGVAASAFLGAALISWGLGTTGQSVVRDFVGIGSMHIRGSVRELASGSQATQSTALASALADLAKAETARQAAVRAAGVFSEDLAREVAARNAAQRSADEARRQLAEEHSARLAAETALNDLQLTAIRERNARESAERTKAETQARLTEERKIEEGAVVASAGPGSVAQPTETGSVETSETSASAEQTAMAGDGGMPGKADALRKRKYSAARKPRPPQYQNPNKIIPPATIEPQWPYGYW